jgi:hypothetical protein
MEKEESAEGADGDSCRCLARAGSFEHITNVMSLVLQRSGKIDMPRPGARDRSKGGILRDDAHGHRNPPSIPILVLDEERNGTAQRLSMPHSRGDLDAILLDSHAPAAAIAQLPAPELVIDEVHIDGHPRGQAFEDSNQAFAV